MKRLSFISFVLSAFLLIGFVACEPINPEVPSVDSGGTSSDSTSVDNGSGNTDTDTTNPDNDAPKPEDFEYVDLGLSVKWATMNVGADASEGYGDFYDYDEAVSRFGNNLPTKEQLQELEDKCTWKWATRNEVNGWEVTGPNGKSIFLPAAGLRGCDGGVCYVGMAGFYWSSALSDSNSDCAWYLELSQPLVVCIFARFRCDGLSVRLVQDNADSTNPDDDIEESGYVDLGLSVKWAAANVGADSPEGYGDFYDYDEAVSEFGINLPRKEQFEELKNKCTWKWTTHKGTDGYKVTGPNGKSIFLPVAGMRHCTGKVHDVGTYGGYWSSTPYDSRDAWFIYFDSSKVSVNCKFRCYGHSVRLVQGNAESTNPDDDIEESGYVDLGLSVKWATMNVGADLPEGYGDFYGFDKAVSEFGNCMPTEDQFEELKDKCTWEWTTQNGINGCKVTGPNGKSIFLPAAGIRHCNSNVFSVGTRGYYWSSTPGDSDYAWYLNFNSSGVSMNNYDRCKGLSVRLVRN